MHHSLVASNNENHPEGGSNRSGETMRGSKCDGIDKLQDKGQENW
jgi:hypothetical protein